MNSNFFPTAGSRIRAARLVSKKTVAEMITAVSFANEAQYIDVEAGHSPLERFAVLLGRLAVRFTIPVSSLLASSDSLSVGCRIAKARSELSVSIDEVCRSVTVAALPKRSREVDDDSECDLDRRTSVPASTLEREEISDPTGLLVSTKEFALIETGGHILFERWMTILSALCRVLGCDAFTIVVGL